MNNNIKIGDKLEIHCYKHNGKLHRQWDEAVVLDIKEDYIVFGNDHTNVIDSDGKVWKTKEPAIMFFFKNRWFNIIGQLKDYGIYFYCNIATPFLIDENVIKYIDYDLVIATYQELKNISEVSRHLNIHPDTISRILKDSNEKIYSASEVGQFYYGKLIKQLDSNTGELIQIFPSVRAAAKFLRPDSSSVGGVVSHITDVCKGKRNMAYGYKWEFVNKTS